MEQRWIGITQTVCKVLKALTAAMLLLVAVGCRALELESPWETYYRAEKYGTEKEKIFKHFNMHRGRWWNYYTRGACYLEHGHYKEARHDFDMAIKIRPDETRDARMYGMHFMDYFPHRETGIAFYFEGIRKTSEGISDEQLRNAKEKMLKCAITKLTASLGQEESSRAKYYLNLANKALWQTSRNDRTPPVVHVNGSIYTNKRIFRLGITVTDDQSGVEEIRIHTPDGRVDIDRPRLLVELAQTEVTETVEITIDPQEKVAVVEIEAFDLAGNPSDPYKVCITVDTNAPMASVTVIGNAQWRGRFAALVLAVDDSGLREIQTGGDQNDRLDCFGKQQYRGTVFGIPVLGELNVRVVDVAGNAVVASIPVGESISRAPIPQAPWWQTPPMFPLMSRIAECYWDRCFSSAHPAELRIYRPSRPVALYLGGDAQTASLASYGVWTASEAMGRKSLQFHFQPHVRRSDGKAKETSQDFFVVEGTLLNAEGVTGIQVDGVDINSALLKKTPMGRGNDLLFSHRVDLTNVPVDRERLIKVTVFQDGGRSTDTILSVIRKNNCVRDPDAVYRAVLLLRVVPTPYRRTILDGVIPRNIYDAVFTSLRKLRTPDPYSQNLLERLRMYDVSSVVGKPDSVAMKMSLDDVLSEAGSGYDLFIHGDIGLWSGGEEKEFAIALRAMDLESKEDLQFQPLGNENTVILAETRVPCKALDEPLDDKSWGGYMDILAAKVGKKLPRIQAVAEPPRVDESIVSIDRGTDNRLFRMMRVCFYTYGDDERIGNVYLKKIGHGRIADTDRQSSRIRPLGLALVESGLIAITK